MYYALGGGLGHLTRALGIARQFRKRRPEPFVILTNCRVPLAEPGIFLHLEANPEPAPEALGELVQCLVRALQSAVLAVDAFPAGILGELPPVLPGLPCRRATLVRRLQERWVRQWALPDLLPLYDTLIEAEPGFTLPEVPSTVRRVQVPPILVRDAGELLCREAARAAWGHAGAGPLICSVVTGTRPADQGLLGVCRRVAARLGVAEGLRLVTPYPGGEPAGEYRFHFPLLEWLPGADLVIGPCGYNLCYETAALGLPAVFVPQPRLYDDQFARAAPRRLARSPEELEQQVREVLEAGSRGPAANTFENGAGAAAQALGDLLG